MTTERQAFLWSSAQRAFHEAPALSRILLLGLDGIARQEAVPLPTRAAQRVCSSCFTLLVPGFSCRVAQQKHPRRPKERRRSLCVKCDTCGRTSSFPMPTPPSSRAAIATSHHHQQQEQERQQQQQQQQQKQQAAALAAGKAKAKKPKPGAWQSDHVPKRQRVRKPEPPVQPSSSSASDGFFGFDFVPL